MASSLYEKQNEELLLKCLVARRDLNSRCKLVSGLSKFILLIGVVFAFFQDKVVLNETVVGWYAVILFGAWVVEKTLGRIASVWKNTAARLQQYFDAKVFSAEASEISPNAFNANFSKSELASVIKGLSQKDIDKAKVRDWYVDASALRPLERILNCQRQSVVWDAAQRWMYVGALLILYAISGVICFNSFSHRELCSILSSLLLAAPFVGCLVDEVIDNVGACMSARSILKRIESLECGAVELDVTRIIWLQDYIYRHRLGSVHVPDWFYWLCRRFLSGLASSHARALEELTHA